MIFLFWFILQVTSCLFEVTADTNEIRSVQISPSTVYVGDRITLRIFLKETSSFPHALPAMPLEFTGGLLHSFQVQGKEIVLTLTPYRAGKLMLPPLALGSFTIQGIEIPVSSLLNTVKEVPQPLKEPLDTPYTNLFLLLFVATALSFPLVYLVWIFWLQSVWVKFRSALRSKAPYRTLLKRFRYLEKRIHLLSPKEFYIEIMDATRQYLANRYKAVCLALTTEELKRLLVQKIDATFVKSLIEIFQRGDRVKFAKLEVNGETCRKDLEVLWEVFEQFEQWERDHGSL
ncbi:MAG: hypothetical protein SNJ78_05765 [Spirochaetales bacterium]